MTHNSPRRLSLFALCLALSVGSSVLPTASADEVPYPGFSMRQREYMLRMDAEVREAAEQYPQRYCESTVATHVDWESFRPILDQLIDREINSTVSAFCNIPVETIGMMCRESDSMKSVIRSSISEFTCHYNGEGRSMSKSGTHIHMTVDFTATNNGEFVRDFLGRNL